MFDAHFIPTLTIILMATTHTFILDLDFCQTWPTATCLFWLMPTGLPSYPWCQKSYLSHRSSHGSWPLIWHIYRDWELAEEIMSRFSFQLCVQPSVHLLCPTLRDCSLPLAIVRSSPSEDIGNHIYKIPLMKLCVMSDTFSAQYNKQEGILTHTSQRSLAQQQTVSS